MSATGGSVAPGLGMPGAIIGQIGFTLRTKGPLGLADRVRTIATRFGPSPGAMGLRLERMAALTAEYGFSPTLPITATVLARHAASVLPLIDDGIDFGVHGLHHNDHVGVDAETQRREIAEAVSIFRRLGMPTSGFRAPYLRADEATEVAVRSAGLLWQSDLSVAFDVVDSLGIRIDSTTHECYQRALDMYRSRGARRVVCRPDLVNGLVRIPVALPDDEMLIDRLHLGPERCVAAWSSVLDETHRQGDLFTMQIHPERFDATTVRGVLAGTVGRPGGVWLASLTQIAEWWQARSRCRIVTTSRDDTSASFAVAGDPRARLHLTAGRGDGERVALRDVVLPSHPMPAVGVPADAPSLLTDFLREEGHLVVTGADPSSVAVHLGADVDAADEIALRDRIAAALTPVLTVAPWPDGRRSALALTGDIDAMTVQDFVFRVRENGRRAAAGLTATTAGHEENVMATTRGQR